MISFHFAAKKFLIFTFKNIYLFFLLSLSIVNIPHAGCNESNTSEFVDAADYVNRYYKNELKKISLSLDDKVLPAWMLSNIKSELLNFEVFSSEDLDKIFLDSEDCLIHYRIRNNKLYFRYNTSAPPSPIAEYTTALYILLSHPHCKITNGDFLLAISDGVDRKKSRYPILCFSKHTDSNYILVPDWYALEPSQNELMAEIERAVEAFPWDNKEEKMFWVGAANGGNYHDARQWRLAPRSQLALFALDNPDIIWAKFTSIKDEKHICSEMKQMDLLICSHKRISPFDSCKYKYLIDVDGYSCGFQRCRWILQSNCVPIKQRSSNVQWFYSGLNPFQHYVPYQTDCSDLPDLINWLRNNDDKAKKIALEGKRFHKKYLDFDTTYLYLYHVLKEYNKLNSSVIN